MNSLLHKIDLVGHECLGKLKMTIAELARHVSIVSLCPEWGFVSESSEQGSAPNEYLVQRLLSLLLFQLTRRNGNPFPREHLEGGR